MKLRHLALWSLSGMLASCTTVYAAVPPPLARAHRALLKSQARVEERGALRIEARVGHQRLRVDGERRTHVLLELSAPMRERSGAAPSNTALVLDRSGSMVGQPIKRAIEAASAWIARTADGDTVSVLAFDGTVEWVVESTTMTAERRRAAIDAVSRLGVGGSTCISCAVDEVLSQFSASDTRVQRVVVLSDGAANSGIVSLEGFAELAARCRQRGVTVTTVGLGTSYNEKVLSLLAFESNGRHHFVAEAAALPKVFEEEARVLRATAATAVEAEVRLAPGVELVGVADRAHMRTDHGVVVPLGSLAMGASKTVLLEVKVPAKLGRQPLATLTVRAHGVGTGDERRERELFVEIDERQESALDPLVGMRIERGRTAQTLREASEAFVQGQRDAALALLDRRTAALKASARALEARDDARAADISVDLRRQLADTEASRARLHHARPSSESGRRASKQSFMVANPYAE